MNPIAPAAPTSGPFLKPATPATDPAASRRRTTGGHRRRWLSTGLGLAAALTLGAGGLPLPTAAQDLPPPPADPAVVPVYIGTYTSGDSEGIYLYEFNTETGVLRQAGLAAPLTNPSFLAFHPTGRWLYAVSEVAQFEGGSTGSVAAFEVNDDGTLELLNQVASGGGGPCHLVVDATGAAVLVANYGGGSVASLPILDDGRLGDAASVHQHEGSSVNERRQQRPHAHSINLSPDNRFAYAADLGIDQVRIYRFDSESGRLEVNDPPGVALPPGSGPRHFTFHPNGRFAWVINELLSTVSTLLHDAGTGAMTVTGGVSTLPEGFDGNNSTAEVVLHPNGRFLYGSNRGHNSIAVFAVDPDDGSLEFIEHQPTLGDHPRNFVIDPTGQWLIAANQNSDNLTVHRIDPTTGRLEQVGQPVAAPSPNCVRFTPTR